MVIPGKMAYSEKFSLKRGCLDPCLDHKREGAIGISGGRTGRNTLRDGCTWQETARGAELGVDEVSRPEDQGQNSGFHTILKHYV